MSFKIICLFTKDMSLRKHKNILKTVSIFKKLYMFIQEIPPVPRAKIVDPPVQPRPRLCSNIVITSPRANRSTFVMNGVCVASEEVINLHPCGIYLIPYIKRF